MNIDYTFRRLNFFEQWNLDKFRFLLSIALTLILIAISMWILPLFSYRSIHDGFIGMCCGLFIGFWMTCIARLCINIPIDIDKLASILESYEYRKTPHGYYEIKTYRYNKFKYQRVFFEKKDGVWVLTGPYNILEKIINQIENGSYSGKGNIKQ
ncbi:hypothetical protein [Rouxiella sp. Mn2063]|uniref:hypothetical protein n=1 Tax=Rouxiella sp. Mn2063 TaxID=3395262 RepID=UPI003BDB1F4B